MSGARSLPIPAGLRRLAERLSRGRVLRRRLPEDLGGRAIFVTPDAMLRFWRRDLERVDPALLSLARRWVEAGASVWDIGANWGLFALAASQRSGPLEPDPRSLGEPGARRGGA